MASDPFVAGAPANNRVEARLDPHVAEVLANYRDEGGCICAWPASRQLPDRRRQDSRKTGSLRTTGSRNAGSATSMSSRGCSMGDPHPTLLCPRPDRRRYGRALPPPPASTPDADQVLELADNASSTTKKAHSIISTSMVHPVWAVL